MIKFNTNKKLIILFSLITICWIILIFIESSQPPPKIFGEIPGLDKVAHLAAYGVLGIMIMTILTLITAYKKIPVLLITVFLVLLAGAFDEFHQSFVPLRQVDGWDLLADFFGGLVAAFTIQRFVKKGGNNHV